MRIELEQIKFKNHPLVTTAEDMKVISSPLKQLGDITHFTYSKLGHYRGRKTSAILSTHPSYTIDIFYPEKLHETAFFGDIEDYQDGFYLWDFFKGNIIFEGLIQHLGLMNGLTIIKRQPDFCEFYCFGTQNKNPMVNRMFINNVDLFESFIHAFHEKAQSHLESVKKHQIIMPETSTDTTIIPSQKKFMAFNAEVGREKLSTHELDFTRSIESSILPNIQLSQREKQCAQFLLAGMTAKQTAKLMVVSHRTVEVYLERLKKRLNCNNKAKLIKTLITHYASTLR